MFSTYLSVFGIIFMFIGLSALIIPAVLNNKEKERYKQINTKVNDYLSNKGFKSSKIYKVKDCITLDSNLESLTYKLIFVNAEEKKVCLIDYQKSKFVIVDFNEIIGSEIVESCAMEDIGFGNNVSLKEKCSEMKLIIKIDNLENPQVIYDIIFARNKLGKGGKEYNILKNSAQEIKSFFDVIKSEKASKRKKFIYCRYCGAKNNEESLKCESCGGSLK